MTHSLSPSIFRAYDIRGIVGETLHLDTMEQIGQALGSMALEAGETHIAVARDGRLSGPKYVKALMKGLCATGIHVLDIGPVPTPVLYYATHELSTTSGVMLTGSHNPVNHNGVKIVIKGKALSGDDIQSIYHRIQEGNIKHGEGSIEKIDVGLTYIQRICNDVTLARPLKVVVDCGNGIAGMLAPRLLKALGCEVSELYCKVDGHFPNHHPDPSQEKNLQDLIQMVCQKRADIGLAFDGDGDRLGVVTDKGDVIWPDRQLILYALDVLKHNPGAKIIYDVKSTRHLDTQIKAHGGEPIMYRTGHSLVKAKIRECGALLGGEMSGHVFFNDRWYGFDDALYTAARLLEILSQTSDTASALFATIPDSVSTPELRIHMSDEKKFEFVDRLVETARFETTARITTIDGLRVDFEDGWGLVRPSNTTPYVIVRFEADDEKALLRVQNIFRQALLTVDDTVQLPF